MQEEAEKSQKRREREEAEMRKQLRKQQEEAERDQLRREKEEAELKKTLGSLLAFDVEAGEHEIELVYSPFCYRVGLTVTCVSLGIFAGLIGWTCWRREKKKKLVRQRYEELTK